LAGKKNLNSHPIETSKNTSTASAATTDTMLLLFFSVVYTLWWWSGTVHKLYPGALTDDGISLFEVGLPIYEEGKERIELKMLTRKDMFKVFDAHYYFSYTVYEHYYEYSPPTTATPITSCYNVRPQDSGEDVSVYYCSVFYLSFYQSFCSI
jgi:hypothetical protein